MVLEWFAQYPFLFYSLIILASLIIISKASDLAVFGISDYAKRLGLSDYLVGLVVVSLAASMPELVAAINGALLGEGGIIFGTIMGSNIVELTLVLGALAIVGKKIKLDVPILSQTKMLLFGLNMLPFVLIGDNVLSRPDGAILIGAFAAYLAILWKREGKLGRLKKRVGLKNLYRDGLIFAGCLVAILIASRLLVFSSIQTAHLLGIAPFYIALTVIGIGSSMSDISVSIRSVLRGHTDVGFGNALGSNLTKSLLFLGVIALIKPIEFGFGQLVNVFIFTIISLAFVLSWIRTKMVDWRKGLLLIGIYLVFLLVEWFLVFF